MIGGVSKFMRMVVGIAYGTPPVRSIRNLRKDQT